MQQHLSSDTVHLQVIRWLEQYLTSRDVSVVVVTHDRAFMESVCTSVLELEAGEVTLHNFGGPGSYDRFRQVRRTQLTLRRECSQPYGLALNMPAMHNLRHPLVSCQEEA